MQFNYVTVDANESCKLFFKKENFEKTFLLKNWAGFKILLALMCVSGRKLKNLTER